MALRRETGKVYKKGADDVVDDFKKGCEGERFPIFDIVDGRVSRFRIGKDSDFVNEESSCDSKDGRYYWEWVDEHLVKWTNSPYDLCTW